MCLQGFCLVGVAKGIVFAPGYGGGWRRGVKKGQELVTLRVFPSSSSLGCEKKGGVSIGIRIE